VLLHPTALPGPHGSGDLGASAYHFVDWLVSAGQRWWQILPLGGIGAGNSPYMSSSAFAGNVLLIDLAELQRRGWLAAGAFAPDPASDASRVDFAAVVPWRMRHLAIAASRFAGHAGADDRAQFERFCASQADWLDDYSLFMALADAFEQRAWAEWPAALVGTPRRWRRAEHASASISGALPVVFSQWHALRAYANRHGVKIVGDIPIFVAWQSADVWAHQRLFELDARGRPRVVAGVPPDYFSATGQRWGNPLYRWAEHQRDGFAWWVDRVRRIFELVDVVRIVSAGSPPAGNLRRRLPRWPMGAARARVRAVARALDDCRSSPRTWA
jgi:4-alpha-glucanotransferase